MSENDSNHTSNNEMSNSEEPRAENEGELAQSSSSSATVNKVIQVSLGHGVLYANRPQVNVGYVEPTLFSFAHEIFQEGEGGSTIYLGPKSAASERAYEALVQAGVKGIVNCTRRVPCYHASSSSSIRYCQVPVHDEAGAPIHIYLDGATTFLRSVLLENNGSVLVHCEQGMSRSATVVMAYLMRFHGMTRDEAYIHCKTKRPKVNPNEGFWEQLQDYEKKLRLLNEHQASLAPKNEDNKEENATTLIDYENWPLESSALFTTCREIPDSLAREPTWQILSEISSKERLDELLFHCLDFIWGRGVLEVDIEWLVEVCKHLPTVLSPFVQVTNMLRDEDSDFSQTWSGEIYPKDTKKILDAMAAESTIDSD